MGWYGFAFRIVSFSASLMRSAKPIFKPRFPPIQGADSVRWNVMIVLRSKYPSHEKLVYSNPRLDEALNCGKEMVKGFSDFGDDWRTQTYTIPHSRE